MTGSWAGIVMMRRTGGSGVVRVGLLGRTRPRGLGRRPRQVPRRALRTRKCSSNRRSRVQNAPLESEMHISTSRGPAITSWASAAPAPPRSISGDPTRRGAAILISSEAVARRSGSAASKGAEYQPFSFGAPARSAPLQQIWTTCAAARPSEEERHLPDGDHDEHPDDRTGPAGTRPHARARHLTREHVC